MTIKAFEERFPVAGRFTISRESRTEIRAVTVELHDGEASGRGECIPYARYGETVEGVIEAIHDLKTDLANGLDRARLQSRLPAGAARNGVDCAFWDLEAKRAGKPVWSLAGLQKPLPVTTAYTISLAPPEKMARQAMKNAARPLLKVKLGHEGDLERIEAVRGACRSTIIVDANEDWSVEQYLELAPQLLKLGVAMVEQPVPAACDDVLADIERPLPISADESCHDRASLAQLGGKYDLVNIKLDKTGGLTEALAMKRQAARAGFAIMVGSMLSTSLAMAPALLVAQNADYVDLDGPLLLARDRADGLNYRGSLIDPPSQKLWG
ncbi:MAG: N-acetyl-D-Glu racemase DgcA [Hyphomicrobiales bacterium]